MPGKETRNYAVSCTLTLRLKKNPNPTNFTLMQGKWKAIPLRPLLATSVNFLENKWNFMENKRCDQHRCGPCCHQESAASQELPADIMSSQWCKRELPSMSSCTCSKCRGSSFLQSLLLGLYIEEMQMSVVRGWKALWNSCFPKLQKLRRLQ